MGEGSGAGKWNRNMGPEGSENVSSGATLCNVIVTRPIIRSIVQFPVHVVSGKNNIAETF